MAHEPAHPPAMTVLAGGLFAAALSTTGLVRAVNEQSNPDHWVTLLVSITGLLAAVASLVAAMTGLLRARDDEEQKGRRRRRR